jgi:hypothetical protein
LKIVSTLRESPGLAILLAGAGFIVALTMVSIEVPAILDMAYRARRSQRPHGNRRGSRRGVVK